MSATRPLSMRPAALVIAAFLLLGAFWGSWNMSLPSIQHSFHLSDTALGVLLALAVGTAGFAGAIVGRLARRFRSLWLLSGILAVWGILAVPPELTHSAAVFSVAFAGAQIAAGCVDAAMNAPATVAYRDEPSSLVRFHALFNVGAIAGALFATSMLASGVSWRWLWPISGVVIVLTSVVGFLGSPGVALDADDRPHSPSLSAVGESAPSEPRLDRSLRDDGLLVFLFVFALAEITEGGAFTWGILYLRQHLSAGILVGTGAYVIGHAVAALARGFGGPLLKTVPVTRSFAVGAVLCAVGLIVEISVSQAWVAAAGLTLATAGTSFFWPLVMSTVARISSSPARAVGNFTAAGYAGWVAGAPIVGAISDHWGASAGLLFMALVCVVVVIAVFAGTVPADPETIPNRPVG